MKPNFESAVRWRQWSVGIVIALFLALVGLIRFNLVKFSFVIQLGCLVLLLSLGLNIYVIRIRSKPGWSPGMADGLLIAGLVLVFIGAFF
jgi:hypothetical protein